MFRVEKGKIGKLGKKLRKMGPRGGGRHIKGGVGKGEAERFYHIEGRGIE